MKTRTSSARRFINRLIAVALTSIALTTLAAPLPPEQTLYDVTFEQGTFVAVGANGTVFSAVDGSPWSLRAAVVTNDLRAVIAGNGMFVAAGDNGVLASSVDGISWVNRTLPDVRLTSVDLAHGNGRFVVAGRGPAGYWTMLVSSNGVNWEPISVEAPISNFALNGLAFGSVTFGQGRFAAVGGNHAASQVLTSTDGLNWREQGMEGTSLGAVGPITHGNGRFTMVGQWYDDDDDDGGVRHSLITSQDGRRWTSSSASIGGGRHAILEADCTTVVAWTYSSFPGFPPIVSYSFDHLTWTQLQGITNSINALAFGNGTFIGVGNDFVRLNIPNSARQWQVHPQTNTVDSGYYAYFYAGMPCLDPPVRYQWIHNGNPLPDATNLYFYVYASAAQAGTYAIVASNPSGSITSTVSRLEVVIMPPDPPRAPTFTYPGANTTNYFAEGQSVGLSVGVDSEPPAVFQWSFNGANIPGATNSYLPLDPVGEKAVGRYTVRASNSEGTAVSPVLTVGLTNGQPPVYTPSVLAIVATAGSPAIVQSYTYHPARPPEILRLLKDGVDTGLPLSLYPFPFSFWQVGASDAGTYTLVASNAYGVSTSLVATLTVEPGGALDHWTPRNPLPQGDTLLKVAHLNGRFIAVGNRGTVVTSPDGTNWSAHRLRTEVDLSGLAYGGSRYLTVGDRSILSSTNSSDWASILNRSDFAMQAVAFANGRFVAVGGGSLVTHTEATGWREGALTPTALRIFRDVAFGSGRWIAVGAGNGYQSVWRSGNGVDWSPVYKMTADLEGITFGGGKFLAVGNDGRVFTSPDGLDWTERNSTVSRRLTAAAYGNNRFVAVGVRGQVLTSPTGVTWTQQNSGTPDRLESVTFGNNLFVAVGENGTTLTSSDGATWSKRNQGSTRDLDGMDVGNGQITIAGKSGTILTSSDGTHFTEQSTGVTSDLHGIGWGGGLQVAVGEPGAIITSPNAVDWTVRSSGSASSLKSVAWGGGRWAAVGTEGEILGSSDGTSWSPVFSPTVNDLNGIAYGNGLFVAVGDHLPPNGTLLTSPDGIRWTRRNQYIGKNLRSVTYANGTFLATANDGILLVSSNGIHWETRSTGNFNVRPQNLRAAAYANGLWIVTGNGGYILTSPDTVNWMRRIPQTVENLHGVVEWNGRFVTIGNRGTVLVSDPVTRAARLSTSRLPGVVVLDVTGEPGIFYQVESTDQLPANSWSPLTTFIMGRAPMRLQFNNPPGTPGRFFRAISP